MKKVTISLFIVIAIMSSCNKEPEGMKAVTMTNVLYGSSAQQNMDIYLPAERSTATTKVMILIHGGAWNSGDKADFTPYVDSMKRREPGYAIVNLNYRLATPPNLFPAQEQDVKAAIEFIYNKRTEYAISDKIVLIGASAGAHLALLQGYKYPTPVRPKAIIDLFGPTDLVDLYNNPPHPLVPALLAAAIGATPASNNTLYMQSSPVNFVSPQSPPTMILHGGADIVVPPAQSVLLKNKLTTAGVVNQYVFYPTEGHGWFNDTLADSFNKIQAFLAAHVN